MSPSKRMLGVDPHSPPLSVNQITSFHNNKLSSNNLTHNENIKITPSLQLHPNLSVKHTFPQQSLLYKKTSVPQLTNIGIKSSGLNNKKIIENNLKIINPKIINNKEQVLTYENKDDLNTSINNDEKIKFSQSNLAKTKSKNDANIKQTISRGRPKKQVGDSLSIKLNNNMNEKSLGERSRSNDKLKLKKSIKKKEETKIDNKIIPKRKTVDRSDSDSEVKPRKIVSKETKINSFLKRKEQMIQGINGKDKCSESTILGQSSKLKSKNDSQKVKDYEKLNGKCDNSSETKMNFKMTLESDKKQIHANEHISVNKISKNIVDLEDNESSCSSIMMASIEASSSSDVLVSNSTLESNDINAFDYNQSNEHSDPFVNYSSSTNVSNRLIYDQDIENVDNQVNKRETIDMPSVVLNGESIANNFEVDHDKCFLSPSNRQKRNSGSSRASTSSFENGDLEVKDAFFLRIQEDSIDDHFDNEDRIMRSPTPFDTYVPESQINFEMREKYYKIQYPQHGSPNWEKGIDKSDAMIKRSGSTKSNSTPESGFQTPEFEEIDDKCLVSLISDMESIDELTSEIAHMNTEENSSASLDRSVELNSGISQLSHQINEFSTQKPDHDQKSKPTISKLLKSEDSNSKSRLEHKEKQKEQKCDDSIKTQKRKKISRLENDIDENKDKRIKSTNKKLSLMYKNYDSIATKEKQTPNSVLKVDHKKDKIVPQKHIKTEEKTKNEEKNTTKVETKSKKSSMMWPDFEGRSKRKIKQQSLETGLKRSNITSLNEGKNIFVFFYYFFLITKNFCFCCFFNF